MEGEEYRWRVFERKDKMGSILAYMGEMEMKNWKRRDHLGDAVGRIILKCILHFMCGVGLNSAVLGGSSRYIQTTCHCLHAVTCLLCECEWFHKLETKQTNVLESGAQKAFHRGSTSL
jgi:butyrate kinase